MDVPQNGIDTPNRFRLRLYSHLIVHFLVVDTTFAISNLTITNTRSTAARNVGLFTFGGGTVANIVFSNIKINGGPAKYFYAFTSTGNSTTGWTVNGFAVSIKTA